MAGPLIFSECHHRIRKAADTPIVHPFSVNDRALLASHQHTGVHTSPRVEAGDEEAPTDQ